MLNVRHLGRSLLAVALLATVLAVSAMPATAQTVFVFENADATDKDGQPTSVSSEQVWQMRLRVTSLGGCTPTAGVGAEGYESGWLRYTAQGAASLNLETCSYSITAEARRNSQEVCQAQVAWGTSGTYRDRLNSADTERGAETSVSIVHKPTSDADPKPICAPAVTVTFTIDPEEVVEDLPLHAQDDELEERVRRAVEVTDFDVRVRPHKSTEDDLGCNILLAFTMQGGKDNEVEKAMEGIPAGTECSFEVFINNRPAPFVIDDDGMTFRTSGTSQVVNVDHLVEIRPARIAIIQDVVGSSGEGGVSYSIERTCAGVDTLPPSHLPTTGPGLYRLPGGELRVTLVEGRFTVHSDRAPNFGPGATYQAAARSMTSNRVEGCSVTVTLENLPAGCTVAGGHTQTLTWRASRPFDHFDFEFDISCDGSPAAGVPPLTDLPPLPGDSSDAIAPADPTVVIVARMRSNGKIEFGLQRQENDGSLGERLLPTRRYFPPTATVDRWLRSSPLTITVAASADDLAAELQVRIVATKRADGRVEFGLQQRENGSWGDRILPAPRRYFRTTATVDRWFGSSALTLDG